MSKRTSYFATESLSPSEKVFGLPGWNWNGYCWTVTDSMGVPCAITQDAHGVYSLSRFERGHWVVTSKDRNPQRLLDCLA